VQPPAHLAELTRKLLLDLVRVSGELNRKGVTDRVHILDAKTSSPPPAASTAELAHYRELLSGLKQGLLGIQDLADQGKPEDASSEIGAVYWRDFEPLERILRTRKPQEVRPLENRFNLLRGEVGAGLKGERLAAELADLESRIGNALGRMEAQRAGSFGAAFAASLITILREGVEVILLLTMLAALVAKTGQPGALRAIRWGVALAAVASVVTAVGLNLLVSSVQGKAQEVAEGAVMLVAAGVLFYVSYWLISQVESKRWMDFLKRQATRGAGAGGFATLGLTAFLAVYREGAETALLYQAMIGGQGQTRMGLFGLAAGLALGLVLLAVIAVIIRAGSVRLPLRAFFQVTGVVLFAMAVIFAGNGINELQSSGILKATAVRWMGTGVPLLGLYPTVQSVSVQALLVAGAALALVVMIGGGDASASRPSKDPQVGSHAGAVS
jgi:high-affinity iron transporter